MSHNEPPSKRYPTVEDYPFLFRLLHWLLWPSLVILTLTGLSQHAIAAPDWSLFSGVLPDFFWPGRVHLYHMWAALVFSPAVLALAWMYWRRGRRARRTHLVLIGGGVALVISGLLLATPPPGNTPGPMLVYLTSRWVHAAVGLVVVPIAFLWHAGQGLTRYCRGLPVVFHPWASPRWGPLLAFIPVVLLTSCLILNGLPVQPAWRTLVAARVETGGVETAELDKLPWDTAAGVQIELAGGLGFDGGRTQVTLQALHDGRDLFVRAQWDDPTEDRRDMPWAKTADGWKYLITHVDDETHYYEDKFSLIFPIQPDWQFDRFGCALQCHAGGGRRYGYKGSSQPVDVWHWKSTRTDPCGQVDDKYWSQVDFENKDVGRHGDPKDAGGYSKNISQDKSHPASLPRDPWSVRYGIIPADSAVDYDSAEGRDILARIPVGAIVPGIVASAVVGDRGDVRCISRHQHGRWQLYIRRKLDTGSQHDVQFVPGRTYAFGCAAFDHSSKRHAYDMTTYWLKLAP